jgi:excisionase family DNA binding protein
MDDQVKMKGGPTIQRFDPSGRTLSPLRTEMSNRHSDPILLTIAEVAAELRMSEKSVRRRIKNGLIRKAPTGGRLVRISSQELRRLGETVMLEPTQADEVSTP